MALVVMEEGVRVLPFLPGDHGAGLGVVGGDGGGAELGEAAVAGLQAGHRAPVREDKHAVSTDATGNR